MKNSICVYKPLWLAIARKYTNNHHQSEELVQEAVARYLQNGNGNIENVKAYVAKTIHHLYINDIRKSKLQQAFNRHELKTGSEAEQASVRFENQSEVRQMLMRMYNTLTPGERAVFILKNAFEVEYEHMAVWLNLSNENCRQLLRRAKVKMLRPCVGRFKEDKESEVFVEAFFKASQRSSIGVFVELVRKELK